MSTRSLSGRAVAALLGLLVGGAVGFLLTGTVGAFFTFVLDRTLDVDGTGALLAAFVAVPVVTAVCGAAVAVRRAGRGPRHSTN
ncbi:hypothetical protein ACIQNU_25315 [Streptomyces sp. NPDC091292]|uniref:hypothetical protein n=1 Tax=Streptomyces sp. NPDC091292 TaxID=3365991 RepID=UPI0037FB2D9F